MIDYNIHTNGEYSDLVKSKPIKKEGFIPNKQSTTTERFPKGFNSRKKNIRKEIKPEH